ncbi:methyltransferase domain-containing protein [Nocardioides sp. SLBN-35]|uniref:methyltransferase domain-containing protein n=1 Tax=Nocardioides sp. SLBN-35 TaxID=2768445 RepID=UPI00114DACA8|nr:methyltransferase domain-containing protein [Nocardioides sp. SLBN-35]TQK68638.1 methyltransferase family protein [Nocardioides sp. SLBN-35]
MQAESSFADTFAAALRSGDCTVIGLHPEPTVVPVGEWTAPAGPLDLAILDLCDGPTLDIGCGPGRMATALAERGQIVLGIDVVAEAVQQTNRRGASALLRDVFANVPAEGRWSTVLLADGNVGIGGDPVALLVRVAQLLAPVGSVVVDLAEPGIPARVVWASLASGSTRSRPFRWAVVGVDDIADLAARAGLTVRTVECLGSRWYAVLGKGRR